MKEVYVAESGFSLKPGEWETVKKYWASQDIDLIRPLSRVRRKDLICAQVLEDRVAELREAFSGPAHRKIVWALRGGYGMQEVLPFLKKSWFSKDKVYIGFSDCTSLHYFLNNNLKIPSVHGPHPNSFCSVKIKKKIFHDYKILLENPKSFAPVFKGLKRINSNEALVVQGDIVGGNLTTLVSILGTPFDKGAKSSILFLEELNEPAYKVNRLLTHLTQSGFLKGVKAVLFGHMLHPDKQEEKMIRKVLKRWAGGVPVPVLMGMQAGHDHENNNPFWMGKKSTLILDESPKLFNNKIL